MKTIKQIADELGVSKQQVYRYVKKHGIEEVQQECINEALQKNNVKYYDESAENLIKQGFIDNNVEEEVHHESHQNHINDTVNDALLKQIEILQNELEIKNNQIEALTRLLDQEQKLSAMNQKKVAELEDKQNQDKKKWWHFW